MLGVVGVVLLLAGCGAAREIETTGGAGGAGGANGPTGGSGPGAGGVGAGGAISTSGGRTGAGGVGIGGDAVVPGTPRIAVDAAWLADRLEDPTVQVVDARTEYTGGRIAGALLLRSESLVDAASPIAGVIAPPGDAEAVLRRAGLRNGTTVVVYGDPPEYEPARVVWALHYYRHGDVRYLDRGLTGWLEEGHAVEMRPPLAIPPTEYRVEGVNPGLLVTGAWLRDQLGPPPHSDVPIQIVDARSLQEYQAGHVPGAAHVEWAGNLQTGRLISGAALGGLGTYPGFDPKVTTVTYCLVGWRASVTWLTLTELGFEDVRVYDASWAEWGQGGFPVE